MVPQASGSGELLDLTKDGVLPGDLLARLDTLSAEHRQAFDLMVAALSKGREKNIDWWVCRTATRNNHASQLFARCMQLTLVRTLHSEGKLTGVLVDDPALATVLYSGGIPIEYLGGRFSKRWRGIARTLREITSVMFHLLAAAIFTRLTRAERRLPPYPLIVVDEFVNRDSFRAGRFVDHYFEGLPTTLLPEDANRLCIMPTFYRIRDYRSTISAMRQSNYNFLLREDYLKFSDYMFALCHWLRSTHLCGRKIRFSEFEVGPLIDSDIRAGRFSYSSVQSLLSYRFLRNAKRLGLNISHLLDWYEGQDIDHAFAAAINWHTIPITHVGYRPVAPPGYLSVTPTQHEVEAEVVPRILAVVGTRARMELSSKLTGTEVRAAPSFRYRTLRNLQTVDKGASKNILVLLPLDISAVGRCAEIIKPLVRDDPTIHWHIKFHPLMPRHEAVRAFGEQAEMLRIVDGPYYYWLARCDLIIGGSTNALAEAVAVGIPAICLATGNQPTEIPIPPWAPDGLWAMCYTSNDLARLIPRLTPMHPQDAAVNCFREQFAGPWSLDEIRTCLGLH